ncbi:LysM peptidoglycan-binding domain-containing protein [uncultured Clostridium sp.]|uniref:LysM peptidoglycan-binding domain-containing protein n=1 Tax=uncultured Clostridium sp. TaxID=59620 RepID=UPI0025D859AE|nr:LysM peptidoglycan-binding domain-containing protein [uncultured Clostridium sp.]
MKKYCYLLSLTIIISLIFITAPIIHTKTGIDDKIADRDEISSISNAPNISTGKNMMTNTDNSENESSYLVQCSNKVHITIQEFINNMQYTVYTVKTGDTLNGIADRYSSTCTLNASLKLIKTANNINSSEPLQSGTILKIPEKLLKNGTVYKVTRGDTWSIICDKYYSLYDVNYIMPLLIFINNFNDTTLPLGEQIYLPKI